MKVNLNEVYENAKAGAERERVEKDIEFSLRTERDRQKALECRDSIFSMMESAGELMEQKHIAEAKEKAQAEADKVAKAEKDRVLKQNNIRNEEQEEIHSSLREMLQGMESKGVFSSKGATKMLI